MTTKDLIYRNIILYLVEPMMVFISVILIVSTSSAYVVASATNFERAVLTLACIIYFPTVFIILMNSIVKKGGLPHNTWKKTHLELEQ